VLRVLRNEIDFAIRQSMRIRRRGCRLPHESKEGLFEPEAAALARRLVKTYGLQAWEAVSGRTDFAASLSYLQMLELALTESGATLPPVVNALDAGCGDWFYVQALYGLLRRYKAPAPRAVTLLGVEVDAYQPYAGFRARIDWAEAFAEEAEGATYRAADIRDIDGQYDMAFMLFPFLFARDLRRWGLPERYLRPEEYLVHVAAMVRPGGWLVIANVGDAERAEQHRLLAACGLPVAWWGRHQSPLTPLQQPRYVTVVPCR